MLMPFAVPTFVCAITACGRPLTMVTPCAMPLEDADAKQQDRRSKLQQAAKDKSLVHR
jgi:hypothetical protein